MGQRTASIYDHDGRLMLGSFILHSASLATLPHCVYISEGMNLHSISVSYQSRFSWLCQSPRSRTALRAASGPQRGDHVTTIVASSVALVSIMS